MSEGHSVKWNCFKLLVVFFMCSSIYIFLYFKAMLQTQSVENVKTELQTNLIHVQPPEHASNINISRSTKESMNTKTCAYNTTSQIPILTLFTTWTYKAEKLTANKNTLKNWASLKTLSVKVILFTNNKTLGEEASEIGWHVLPMRQTVHDIPVLKDMYLDAMETVKSHFYAFANGDILFTDTLVHTLRAILSSNVSKCVPMMIIGLRTNIVNVLPAEASDWSKITKTAKSRGRLFATNAEDYFITMASYPWKDIPNLVIGRRAYDNWLVSNARKRKSTVIDASKTLLAVHQTSKSGNYEHNKSKHNEYNHSLLVKLYKKVYYDAGFTNCGEHYTEYNKSGFPVVLNRKVKKHCL